MNTLLLGAPVYGVQELVRSWQFRDTPLIIKRSGRILYGEQVICSAGAVSSVSVSVVDYEGEIEDEYCVRMLRACGEIVELPSPYLNKDFDDQEQARSFADKLARALAL